MKAYIYSLKKFESGFIDTANKGRHEFSSTAEALSIKNARKAAGCDGVLVFANDDASAPVIEELHAAGVKYIMVRAAGYDNVDIHRATELGIRVANTPEYSPYAIAEHTLALILALNRRLIRADRQIRQNNFLLDGLTGFDLNGKCAGIVGTGKIGAIVAKILHGFGCRILACDIKPDARLAELYNVTYTDMDTLCKASDIITIHTGLNASTRYLIHAGNIATMKKGVMLINVSRGAIVNTSHVIDALESGQIGYLGLDVYEREKGLFFYDHSDRILEDDMLIKLLSFPNVLITGHQAFLTDTALNNIAEATIYNMDCFEEHIKGKYELTGN